jgi:PAS domain S-box-containing protein
MATNIQEITEQKDQLQKQTEELELTRTRAEQEQVKYEAILGSIAEGIIVTGKDGNIVLINPAAEALLGWKLEEIIGKPITEAIPIEDSNHRLLSQEMRPITKVLTSGEKISGGLYFFYKKLNNTTFPIALTVSPILLKGTLIGAVELFRDISDEIILERAKSEFVALASHQLRTPISAIRWFTEMLLHEDAGPITPEQKDQLTQIDQSNQRMATLVDGLLNVSRVEMGNFSIKPELTDLTALSSTVLMEVRRKLLPEKKLTFAENYDTAMEKIALDPDIMKIILQNLFSNAIKYTPENGSITVEIGLAEENEQTSETGILLKVIDTGYGIPESQQGKIFTKLFRADNAKEKDTDGTGLGLYIVQSLVTEVGGKIWFRSKENEGTTFFVFLPKSGMKEKKGEKTMIPEK